MVLVDGWKIIKKSTVYFFSSADLNYNNNNKKKPEAETNTIAFELEIPAKILHHEIEMTAPIPKWLNMYETNIAYVKSRE